MRVLHSLLVVSGITTVLVACGESESVKSEKREALNGRQEVRARLAHATEATGDYAAAEKMYLQLVSQSPNSVEPHVELAQFYNRHHEDQKAVASLKDALKIEPENSSVERELANTYISENEPEKALTVLETAIAANSKDPLLYNSQGVALDQVGSYSQAQKSYRTAFDLDPSQSAMYKVNMSMSYILSGSYDKAIAMLRPMLDQPDAPPIVRQNLALAYGLKGENDSALKLGLEDLSESEASENVRFYRMLAHKHSPSREKQSGANDVVSPTVPASLVKDLFTEQDPQPQFPPDDKLATATPTPGYAVQQKPLVAQAAPPLKPVAPTLPNPITLPFPGPLVSAKPIPPMPETLPNPPITPALLPHPSIAEAASAGIAGTQEVVSFPPLPALPDENPLIAQKLHTSTVASATLVTEQKPAASNLLATQPSSPAPKHQLVASLSRHVAAGEEGDGDETLDAEKAEKPTHIASIVKHIPANEDEEDEEEDSVSADRSVTNGKMPLAELAPSSGVVIESTPEKAPDSSLPVPLLKPDRF